MIKRSITIKRHRTSVTIEDAFWDALKDIAADKNVSLNVLIETIDETQPDNLSSAIRVFVLGYYKKKS